MSRLKRVKVEEITINLDKKRIPLSSNQRENLAKLFPYYGAQGIVDYVDNFLFDGEYILVAEDGENLKSQKANVCNLVKGKFWVNNHAHILAAKEGNNLKYIYYLLNLLDFRPHVTGSAQPKLTQENLSRIELLIHNTLEQQKIATVLSTLDAKIELNNRINAELEQMAKTLYDYWFVQFDFPFDFAQGKPDAQGKPYKSSGGIMVWSPELKREVPEGWEVKPLMEFANFKNGTGIKKEDLSEIGKYEVLGSNGVIGKTNQMLFSEPAIAIGRVGANYGEVNYSLEPCWITDNAITAQVNSDIYLWWLISTLRDINYSNISGGSAQPLITQGQLKVLKFAVPNNRLFEEFHSKVKGAYMLINSNNKQNQHLSSLRDWLLPMLMNGQVKVGETKGYMIGDERLGMVAEP